MKNILFTTLLLSTLMICSCGQRNTATQNATESRTDSIAEKTNKVLDSLTINPELGELLTRNYSGQIPAADCPGIIYDLTLYNQQYSGDGVFALTMTYIEAENGKDLSFDSYGRWGTLRGDATDKNATVYELREFGSNQRPTYMLYQVDSLTMLDAELGKIQSGFNYTIKKK